VLADIQAFVQRRQEEDERRRNDIEDLEEEMDKYATQIVIQSCETGIP